MSDRQWVRVTVPWKRRRVVHEHVREVPRPHRGVVDFVGLVEQPHRRSQRLEALAPTLHEAAAVHDEQQVGTEAFDLLRQLRIVPICVLARQAE
jgi:hypothetical protein